MNALSPSPHPIAASRLVHYLAAACVALRAGPGACRACVEACPAEAISFGVRGCSASADCLGCGKCAAACTPGALAVKGFENPLPSPGGTVVRVECTKVPESLAGRRAVRVPCLGGLAPGQWLAIAEGAGSRRVIAIDRGWCTRCAAGNGVAAHPAQSALTAANALLAELGWPDARRPRFERDPLPFALMPTAIPTEQPASLARRGFFSRLGGEARRAVGLEEESAPPPRLLKAQAMAMPARDHLLAVTQRLARAGGHPLPAAAFFALAVAPACRDHGACAAMCPSGALTHHDEGGLAGLEFDAWRCLGCGQCVRGCPEQALSLQPASFAPAADVPQRLTAHAQTRCQSCLQPFHGAPFDDTCPACRRNRNLGADLFGTLLAEQRAGKPF